MMEPGYDIETRLAASGNRLSTERFRFPDLGKKRVAADTPCFLSNCFSAVN